LLLVNVERSIDGRLIADTVTFGLGWGLVGYCPGPAIAGLGFGLAKTSLFVGAMLMGMACHHVLFERRSARGTERILTEPPVVAPPHDG
jgi:uncharacterized membrane protein YedE/YeeE